MQVRGCGVFIPKLSKITHVPMFIIVNYLYSYSKLSERPGAINPANHFLLHSYSGERTETVGEYSCSGFSLWFHSVTPE